MSRMPGAGAGIPPRILQEAAGWFASLADSSASEDERRRWKAWISADPVHARAWEQVEAVTGRFVPIADTGDAVRGALEVPARRKVLRAMGLLVLAGGSGLIASRQPWREWRHDVAMLRADYKTGLGQVVTLLLPDNSRIWLGSLSALDLDYNSRFRRLALHQGDLLVETAMDNQVAPRPFVTDTPHGRLRALGTRFAVRSTAGDSRIDVFEGAVELTPADSESVTHVVHAGEHALFNRRDLVAVGRASTSREAWSRGILLADRMRLDDLVAELARWHALPIFCDPAVAGLQLVGAYPLKDLERILAALGTTLPIAILRDDHRVRIVAAAASPSAPAAAPFDTPPRRAE